MEIKVLLPIKIKVDNVEAIWLAINSGISERMKHIDVRAHIVRSFVMDEVVTIDFVKSAENKSGIMTKNQQCVHFLSQHNPSWYILLQTWQKQRRKFDQD